MTDTTLNLETDDNYDVFDDSKEETQAEAETEELSSDEDTGKTEETEETSEDTGDKEETDATPAEAEGEEDSQSDKMIPEHRFKAALKNVTDELDAAKAELAKMKAQPAPDRNSDPDGYDLHQRVETSKAIMAETHTDYNDVIRHYQEMEKSNPLLAQVVAAHPIPAKHAYDIAKKDMEIRELSSLKQSSDWAEFQEFQKQKKAKAAEDAKAATEAEKLAAAQKKQERRQEFLRCLISTVRLTCQ